MALIAPTGDPALRKLIAAAWEAERAGDGPLARRMLIRATRLYPTAVDPWQALARMETGARQAICRHWVAHLQPALAVPPVKQRRRTWLLVPTTAGLLAALWGAGTLPYRAQLLPGITINGLSVGGLRPVAAESVVSAALADQPSQRLTITGGGRRWSLDRRQLTHLNDQAITEAYQVGHSGAWLTQATDRWYALTGSSATFSALAPRADVIDLVVEHVARAIEQPPLDAQLVRSPFGFAVSPSRFGQAVDRADLRAQLVAAATTTGDDAAITVRVMPVPPQQTVPMLVAARDQLNALQRQPLWLQAGDQRWPVDRTALLRYDAASRETTVDATAVAQLVQRLAAVVDHVAQPSQIKWRGDRVDQIVPGQSGQALDRPAAVRQLSAALLQNIEDVQVPVAVSPPPPGEAERLGLIAELGHGDSQFVTYSSPERDANVVAGGQDIDGVLIPPGGEFSFTGTVGDITWEKGYRWGEMIEAGEVKPSLGGGICQVSTTVFRAALATGLPITERHSHSWRLAWYEVDSAPGLDATISLGGPDLRFRNDTPGHILLKVTTDLVHKRQKVTIYGTPTGRQVSIIPHPEQGVVIERQIKEHDVVRATDVFVSHYSR